MTRVTGSALIVTPCCHAQYSTPQYGSMNFSAFAYWTPGFDSYLPPIAEIPNEINSFLP
jgi:hypothetical protein